MNYFELHIGDYLKDTAHLSLLEHGIYARLLHVYYTRECAIPDDQAARLIGARTKEELAGLRTVLREFFTQDDQSGDWIQLRCEEEINRFQDKQRKAKASANARWSQTDRNANASTNAMRTHSEGNAPRARPQTPDTRHQTPEEQPPQPPKGGKRVSPAGFEEFWQQYPRKVGKDDAAKAFAARKPDAQLLEVMLAALARQRASEQWRKDGGQFIPHPATWLRQGRWQDEVAPPAAPKQDQLMIRNLEVARNFLRRAET